MPLIGGIETFLYARGISLQEFPYRRTSGESKVNYLVESSEEPLDFELRFRVPESAANVEADSATDIKSEPTANPITRNPTSDATSAKPTSDPTAESPDVTLPDPTSDVDWRGCSSLSIQLSINGKVKCFHNYSKFTVLMARPSSFQTLSHKDVKQDQKLANCTPLRFGNSSCVQLKVLRTKKPRSGDSYPLTKKNGEGQYVPGQLIIPKNVNDKTKYYGVGRDHKQAIPLELMDSFEEPMVEIAWYFTSKDDLENRLAIPRSPCGPKYKILPAPEFFLNAMSPELLVASNNLPNKLTWDKIDNLAFELLDRSNASQGKDMLKEAREAWTLASDEGHRAFLDEMIESATKDLALESCRFEEDVQTMASGELLELATLTLQRPPQIKIRALTFRLLHENQDPSRYASAALELVKKDGSLDVGVNEPDLEKKVFADLEDWAITEVEKDKHLTPGEFEELGRKQSKLTSWEFSKVSLKDIKMYAVRSIVEKKYMPAQLHILIALAAKYLEDENSDNKKVQNGAGGMKVESGGVKIEPEDEVR